MSATPCHEYYDLEIVNQSLSDTSTPPSQLSFTEVRASSVLDNPNDYFMSIVRFSVDTAGSLPVVLPQIDLTQEPNQFLPSPPAPPNTPNPNYSPDFPNRTVYSISFNYTDPSIPALVAPGINFTAPVIYVPHLTATGIASRPEFNKPGAPLTINKTTGNYFWVQSFNWWINTVNTSIATAWAGLAAAVLVANPGNANFTPPSTYLEAPYLTWDNQYNIATLWVPTALFNQGFGWNPETTPNPALAAIYFNAPLHILFSSFEYVFNSYNPPDAFLIRCYDRRNVGYSATSNYQLTAPSYYPPAVPPAITIAWAGGGLAMVQAYSSGPTMCPVSSMVFTTSLLPVVPSLIGLPRIFLGASSATQAQGNNNIQNQLTDLEVFLGRGDEYLPFILYSPVAEYRLLDLQSNAPLQSIQISVAWKDAFGVLHPFYLQNGCGATIKIMFRKKIYNNIVPFS